MTWAIKDYSDGKMKGYLQLTQHGIRVCDFFPYAKDADSGIIKAQAEYICRILNEAIAAETARCAKIARSLDAPGIADTIELGP